MEAVGIRRQAESHHFLQARLFFVEKRACGVFEKTLIHYATIAQAMRHLIQKPLSPTRFGWLGGDRVQTLRRLDHADGAATLAALGTGRGSADAAYGRPAGVVG